MSNSIRIDDTPLYKALTLTERVALLAKLRRTNSQIAIDRELAQRRLDRWQSQTPFKEEDLFAQRLALDNLTEDDLLCLLGAPVENLSNVLDQRPAWVDEINQALTRQGVSSNSPLPQTLGHRGMAGFLHVIEPLLDGARERLREGARRLKEIHSDAPFDHLTVEELFLDHLSERILSIVSRTLALELNVARLQDLLHGETAEERFRSFFSRLRRSEHLTALFHEYPVLARQLMVVIEQWVTVSLEFLQHLCADWEEICETLSPRAEPGALVQLKCNAGDQHHNGRAVQIATFNSGLQVVYKPKSLSVDLHFQQFLNWLNQKGACPPFRLLKLLNRHDYGWVEFIAAESCTSVDEIHRFYERQGGYLALLYVMQAVDFHYENLIAAGEHPVLIDLEALFHRHVMDDDLTQSDLRAGHELVNSVLRVGILPQRVWSSDESAGIDIGGLSAVGGQLFPKASLYWEGTGTDEMRLARKHMKMSGAQNRPTIDSADVNAFDYVEAIIRGFTSIYQLLQKNRDELLSDDGPLNAFSDDEVRIILRPTMHYGLLLEESFHPDLLRDALDRDRFFDRLWIGIKQRPRMLRALTAERADLLRGDVPMFTSRPGSDDLWDSAGNRSAGFFDGTGIAQARRCAEQLDDKDLAQQIWIIRASLTSMHTGVDRAQWPSYHLTEPADIPDRQQLLDAARAIGERLDALARRSENDSAWIGLTIVQGRHWSLEPLGLDLYSGVPGIALFLAYLGTVTEDERYTAHARASLTTIRRQVARSLSSNFAGMTIGSFTGWGGVIYTLTQMGVLWNDPALFVEAEKIADLLPELIGQDKYLDIIGGAAGCIESLLSLYKFAPNDRVLAAAIQCGDHLIACARPLEQGIGWITPTGGTVPLAGFSHGSAGIAWALLRLSSATGEERFYSTALAAIAHERTLYSPEAGNWLDLRESEMPDYEAKDANFMTTWCHGAAGVGLARLDSLPQLDDELIRAEIATAMRTTLAQGFGRNHSLCHGDLGNVDILMQSGEKLDDDDLRSQVRRLTAIILESINEYGWICGTPQGVESPGLMTGLAGIGYGLLRLAEPLRVPSVLTLAPPRLAHPG